MNTDIFKVIKIVSEKQIVINGGSNKGLNKGDELEIFERGEKVFDPDTKECLGTLDTIKATVEVVAVYPKMCLCMDIQYENSLTPIASALAMAQGKKVKVSKRLNIDSTQISGGLSNNTKISIGDLARISLG